MNSTFILYNCGLKYILNLYFLKNTILKWAYICNLRFLFLYKMLLYFFCMSININTCILFFYIHFDTFKKNIYNMYKYLSYKLCLKNVSFYFLMKITKKEKTKQINISKKKKMTTKRQRYY